MTDLDTLRPEVREALDDLSYFLTGTHNHDDFYTIRAELLRLAGEVTELRALCAATYQAAGCYGLPERFKDALSNAATGERIHDVDVDNLCPVDPVEWVERAEKAEDELAALKARIAASGRKCVHRCPDCRVSHVTTLQRMIGKRVRLVVEDWP